MTPMQTYSLFIWKKYIEKRSLIGAEHSKSETVKVTGIQGNSDFSLFQI